ncbi:hypothetical protein SAMN05421664_3447 [Chryseobacterium soldanellicola]|uniref:Lipocalin-like domain-containing protein n=1 Tax=Chryseobacterium soldanellicola TaxID=311333 RepID=A0A1H1G4W1_9FLAO|nr:hypothetical protein [Chryseobacterium soldanellicola]SDR08183.1 hypothetical protein SAMN05421664_3447 [Chryseobacterium soldanellicola]
MNYVKTLSVVALFLGISQINAQKKTDTKKTEPKKEAVKQKPADNPTKCTNIKEGTFLRINYPKNLWYMTIKDNVQTEYYNDGKEYVKSSLVFLDDCNYKAVVIDVKGNDRIKVDDVFTNKVIATRDSYIKIQSQIAGDKYDFILVKVK